jgi:hypothetical protein
MAGELSAVVEGDSLAQLWRHAGEEPDEMTRNAFGRLVGWPGGEQQSGLPLVDGQDRLAVFGEQHEVGFPVSRGLSVGGGRRPFGHGNTAFDEGCGAAAAAPTEASLALAAGQIEAPAVVLGAGDLSVDEAVDALVADHRAARFAGQPTGHLFGGPAMREPIEHGAAQGGLAFQARPRPAPRPRLLLSVTGFVRDTAATVASYLARDGRWRAIQSCSDLPDRLSFGLKTGNLASLVQRQLLVLAPHGNTSLRRCCTSFVNSGDPVCPHKTNDEVLDSRLRGNERRMRLGLITPPPFLPPPAGHS